MSETHYVLRTPASDMPGAFSDNYQDLTKRLLNARGITTEADTEAFFARAYEGSFHDPFLLPDMEKAVERILTAIRENEHIVVYSDYDCDGIPGGVLMHDFFEAIGYTNFQNYIPHRHEEGYGLNQTAIEKLARDGARLLITVDCGITDVFEVAHASSLGIDVIVTDHHEPGDTLPAALAVINPKRKDNKYPFRELCGSGVAWKLIAAVLSRNSFDLKVGQEKWWLDVVGLATIADMVPLSGENRLLAHYGLMVMRKNRRLGLQHLFRTMRMDASRVTEDDIGFMVAPRINAASRMGVPEDAFKLLTAKSEEDAGTYARHLDHINNERKGIVGAMVKDIKKRIEKRTELSDVLVVGDPLWRPALVGLAANSLVEEYMRPVFVWGRDGRSILKGSCRGDGSASVVELMYHARDLFLEYGGHHVSGGFSVREERIHEFGERLNDVYRTLKGNVGDKGADMVSGEPICIDAELTLSDVGVSLVKLLNDFTPFGEGNAKPLFLFRAVLPQSAVRFGKAKEHLRVTLRGAKGTIEAISFFVPTEIAGLIESGGEVNLVAHVEESHFMGRSRIRLRIVDALPVGSPRLQRGV